jgi:hypothetical protein
LVLRESPITLNRRRGLSALLFGAAQRFEIVEDDRFEGEWKVATKAYAYVVSIRSRRLPRPQELMEWHWHPLRTPQRPEPHLHVRSQHRLLGLDLPTLHIPTGRVSFEEVVRFLIEEMRVVPTREDWQAVIADTERRFREFRTWA